MKTDDVRNILRPSTGRDPCGTLQDAGELRGRRGELLSLLLLFWPCCSVRECLYSSISSIIRPRLDGVRAAKRSAQLLGNREAMNGQCLLASSLQADLFHDAEFRFEAVQHLSEKRLPIVFSCVETLRILHSPSNLKHRAILARIYSAGLRVSELRHLQGCDIDGAFIGPSAVICWVAYIKICILL